MPFGKKRKGGLKIYKKRNTLAPKLCLVCRGKKKKGGRTSTDRNTIGKFFLGRVGPTSAGKGSSIHRGGKKKAQ